MNSTTVVEIGAAIENLYPALTECFAIILCGYIAGRMNLISEIEAKGINIFIGTFSLPSLIFMSLVKLNLTSVNWLFLVSILISKSIIFFTVIIITLLVSGRPLNYSRAGIFAIFCTQSNDFAIGYPIVVALYKNIHPDYAAYLYLMAPISLAILNPISFIFMEIGKRNMSNNNSSIEEETLINRPPLNERFKMMIVIVKSVFTSPIILMTILGILGNLIFTHKIPLYIGGVLDALGSAFSASALFLLGLRMVGKVHKLKGYTLVVPGILIAVKLLALPLVIREVVSLLHSGSNISETVDLSTYGFLYGTFPSAPTVFVFSTQYSIEIDLIASAMVACTFISAPLMFVSAKMITITKTDPSEYIKQLDAYNLDISIVAIIVSIWVIFVFTITKKIWKLPHKITTCLIISHMMSCIGAILWNTMGERKDWVGFFQFFLFTFGIYSTRLWTMNLSIILLFLQCRSLCYILHLQPIFYLIGWILPFFITIFLYIFDKKTKLPFNKQNPNFVYGITQAIVAVSLLVLSFIVTVGCLILHERYRRRYNSFLNLSQDIATNSSEENSPENETTTSTFENNTINPNCTFTPNHRLSTIEENSPPIVDIEDLVNGGITINSCCLSVDSTSSNRFNCLNPNPTNKCSGIVKQYQETIDNDLALIEEENESHNPQILRHTVLLILLLISMFIGLSLSIWTLIMDEMSGIYVELSFLDATLNFGQSIIIFTIFGLDTKEIILPILKVWRTIIYGKNTLNLPSWDELNNETKQICEQFQKYHLINCRETLTNDYCLNSKIYRHCISGYQFVDWLIDVGLARDRIDGVHYARHLIEGRLLRHINYIYHFYDRNLLYTFD